MNEYQERRFVARMLKEMFGTIAGKRIALLGFAFKADTGDTRESPAILVARELLAENADVVITDPQALEYAKTDLADVAEKVTFEPDPYKAAEGAHAVALLTEWAAYKELDYQKIFKDMESPAFLFDGRNLLDHQTLYDIGFNVYSIGKAPLKHI